MSSKKRRYAAGSGEALCCCEYDNMSGEKSHVLAACCDCEAVDWMCDRCLTCQQIPEEVYDRACLTISDRLRIPWCSGSGAIRMNPDIVIPIVSVMLLLLLATIHYVMTVLCLTVLPSLVLCQYRVWTRRKNKPRTQVFYMWGLVSTWIMFIVFFYIALTTHKVAFFDLVFLLTIFIVMMIALVHARKEPGFIPIPPPAPKETRQDKINRKVEEANALRKGFLDSRPVWTDSKSGHDESGNGKCNSHSTAEQIQEQSMNHKQGKDVGNEEAIRSLSSVGALLVDNFQFKEEDVMTAIEMRLEDDQNGPSMSDYMEIEDVVWVDSRPIQNGYLITWCAACGVERPPRSGHCPVCERCVLGRDHHCVWIDNCVGAHNHRAFISAIVLFLTGGLYGAWVGLHAICPPTDHTRGQWTLLGECKGIYHTFLDTFAFVCTCYALIACFGISLIFLNQLVFIAQNITSQEAHMASQRRWTKCLVYARNNIHNRGIIRNLITFISGKRKHQHTYSIVT